jgi:hypothetical protein
MARLPAYQSEDAADLDGVATQSLENVGMAYMRAPLTRQVSDAFADRIEGQSGLTLP